MKVNLLLDNPKDILNGYINIDPLKGPVNDERLDGDITCLDAYIDDAEAEEILAIDVLDYYQMGVADDILNNWIKKLKIGGELVISCVDLREVTRLYEKGTLNFIEINRLLHGDQDKDWNFRKCSLTLEMLIAVLKSRELKIITAKIDNLKAIVRCKRVK